MAKRKRTAKVFVLPGVERRDLIPKTEARDVIAGAFEDDITSVVICGIARDGSLWVRTSVGDADRAVGLLMRAVTRIAEASIDNDMPVASEHPDAR
jgi:hypothetical protein